MPLLELQKIRQERDIVKPKKIYNIPKKSNKKIEQEKTQRTLKPINAATHREDLEDWFNMVADEIKKNPFCMECGAFIKEKYYRHASAHILPKSIFKSVATNKYNFLILGASCGCHHAFDNGFATQMEVFKQAKARFDLFKNEVKEKHKLLNLFL